MPDDINSRNPMWRAPHGGPSPTRKGCGERDPLRFCDLDALSSQQVTAGGQTASPFVVLADKSALSGDTLAGSGRVACGDRETDRPLWTCARVTTVRGWQQDLGLLPINAAC